jgi:hypothetical protein
MYRLRKLRENHREGSKLRERTAKSQNKDTSEIALEIKTFNDAYQSERKSPMKPISKASAGRPLFSCLYRPFHRFGVIRFEINHYEEADTPSKAFTSLQRIRCHGRR